MARQPMFINTQTSLQSQLVTITASDKVLRSLSDFSCRSNTRPNV